VPGLSPDSRTLSQKNPFDSSKKKIGPFFNSTTDRIIDWNYRYPGVMSIAGLDSLVHDVILAPDFDREHLVSFSAARELKRLDDYSSNSGLFLAEEEWKQATVSIPLPPEDNMNRKKIYTFEVHGVHYRSVLDVIKTAFRESTDFHFTPFQFFWQPFNNAPAQRIISELYNSDAFLQEHQQVWAQQLDSECNLERVVAALMLWSDATHLANFGTASLWPVYLYFGNQTKYKRCKPSAFAVHHIAYLPKVFFSLRFS
jgi:hypothetical protein